MEDLINERCGWAGTDPLYVRYHDEEWGRPVTDDNKLFEFLLLESAQAGFLRLCPRTGCSDDNTGHRPVDAF